MVLASLLVCVSKHLSRISDPLQPAGGQPGCSHAGLATAQVPGGAAGCRCAPLWLVMLLCRCHEC